MAILVAYDSSSPAEQAVEYAFREYPDEELVLLHVLEAAGGSTGAGFSLLTEQLKEREDEMVGKVSDEVRSLLEDETVEYRVETAVGEPAREVVEFAAANDIDQIIVGSHGRSGVSRVLLGSVAEKIVRRAPVPVTVVR